MTRGKGSAVKDDIHVTVSDLSMAEEIIDLHCAYYNIPVEMLKGPRFTDDLSAIRDEVIYRLRTELWLTFKIIGRLLGNRSAATVAVGFKRYYKQEVLSCPQAEKSRKFRKTWKPYE